MNKNWLKILVAISAVMIAGSAAYFSVTGLGVLFSGAAIAVMVMAGSLEFAKLVTATYLKQEWDNIQGINKWYLTSAVVILMAITSAGIFGYLSNAFQQQNLKLNQVQREIDVWEGKIKTDTSQISLYTNQLNQLQSNNNTVLGNSTSRSSLRFATSTSKEQSKIRNKISALNDSIVVYNGKINDIKNANIGIEREVGGFRFVAESFGVSLNSVVKFFIILIVIVFDPLAVALVISFNQLVAVQRKKEDEIPSNPNELKDFVDETSRLHLSEEDIKKLEEVLLNPPKPNEALVKAAEEYKEKIEDKPWKGVSQEVWDRMAEIEKQREAIHGPILDEDVPTGALANSGIRERLEMEEFLRDEEPYAGPLENSEEKKSSFQKELENFVEGYDPITYGEEISIIEPTEEEEDVNFSNIEPISENIFQEEEIIPFDETVHNEPEMEITDEDIIENLNLFQEETFSEEPTTLNEQSIQEEVEEMISQALSIPPIEEKGVHVELPSEDSGIEDEKKKS